MAGNTFGVLLWVYLVVALLVTIGLNASLAQMRRSEKSEDRKQAARLDQLEDDLNLQDSGFAVLAGLLWPVLIVLASKGKKDQ